MNCGIHKMRFQGYFHDDQSRARRWAWARVRDQREGKDYECRLDIRRIAKDQRPKKLKELANRFFSIHAGTSGIIRLCECRFTKKDLVEARKRAEKTVKFFETTFRHNQA